MSNAPLVHIIILNWNNGPDTLACLESCRRLDWSNFRILVVDNGSSDGSPQLLAKQCGTEEFIQSGANLGFAGGNNVGIRRALEQGAAYIWLLNNDALAAPGALSALVEIMESHPDTAIAGSKIYFQDAPQKIWFAGGAWQKGRLRLRQRGAYQEDRGGFDEIIPIGAASGCSMLVRASALQMIGLMDESYFLYWEDTDWCARAWEKGYRVLLVPASKVWHKVSASVIARSELQYYYYTRNGLHFCRHHDLFSGALFLLYVSADALTGGLWGNRAMLRGFAKGAADFLLGRRGKREFT